MARYRKLIVQGETGWYLMNPRNPWEAMKLAWYLWRHPDRVGALVGVSKEFMLAKCKPESPNVEVRGDAPLYGAASLSTDGLGSGG